MDKKCNHSMLSNSQVTANIFVVFCCFFVVFCVKNSFSCAFLKPTLYLFAIRKKPVSLILKITKRSSISLAGFINITESLKNEVNGVLFSSATSSLKILERNCPKLCASKISCVIFLIPSTISKQFTSAS